MTTTTIFQDLEQALQTKGAEAALSDLCEHLIAEKRYEDLFYARVMAKRFELGLSPVPTLLTQDVPGEKLAELEDTIREACREVGELYLQENQIAQAWPYFRMIGEQQPVEQALREYQPDDEDEIEDLIQITLTEGVLPQKGFDWVLDRYGLCSAITTLGSQQVPGTDTVRQYCIGRVLWALHEELRERLIYDIQEREGKEPPEAELPERTLGTIRKLIEGRDELFENEAYHVDLSHLSSVIQMSVDLPPGEELEVARELCEYGRKLEGGYGMSTEPPFDDFYNDYAVYLAILAGERIEEGVEHFRKKAEENPVEEAGSGPAVVYVQLLNRLGRHKEAAEAACKYWVPMDDARLGHIAGICEQAKAYEALARTAKENNNPLQYLAGMLGSKVK